MSGAVVSGGRRLSPKIFRIIMWRCADEDHVLPRVHSVVTEHQRGGLAGIGGCGGRTGVDADHTKPVCSSSGLDTLAVPCTA